MVPLPPESHRLQPDTHPTPFSAAEISRACAPGRSNTFLVERAGESPYLSRWEFTAGDEQESVGVRWTETTDGTVIEPRTKSRATWRELQEHASYPTVTTAVTEEVAVVPAGRFACWVYTTEDDGTTTRAWFAKDLPGPPIMVRAEAGGSIVFSSTLMAVTDPRA
jgi:hypothetical protein